MTPELSQNPSIAGARETSEAEESCRTDEQWPMAVTIVSRIPLISFLVGWFLLPEGGQLFGADAAPPSLPVVTPEEIGYSVVHWTVEDGLPGRIITSLAQTPDGYLWCGSPSGLARYDGAKFTVFYPDIAPALKGMEVVELRCDAEGRLWIAGIKGQLAVYEHGRFRRLGESDGISEDYGYDLGGICEGELWIKSRSGDHFYRYHGDRFESVDSYHVSGSTLQSFQTDASGVRWGVQMQPRVMVHFTDAGREVQPLVASDGKSEVWAGRLFKLPDGTLAVTSSHGVYALVGGEWVLIRGVSSPIGRRGVYDGVQDWYGNFWVSVLVKGLILSTPDGRTAVVSLPDSNNRVHIRALLLGAAGNLWAAGDDGVYQLRRCAFQPQPSPPGETRQKPSEAFVQDTSGSTWIIYPDGWARQTGAGWTFTPHSHPGYFLWTGTQSRDGSVLLGYNFRSRTGGSFVEKIPATGRTEELHSLSSNPRIIFESSNKNLWVGTDVGLWHWEGNRFVQIKVPNESGRFPVRGLAEDREGRLYVGVYRRGLFQKDGTNAWQQLTSTADDAGSEGIWGIHVDDEGTLWLATDSGLARWRNGRWYSYAESRAVLPRLTRSVICDRHSAVWMAGQFGVVRVERSRLNALAAGQEVTLGSDWFDRSDGLPSIYCAEEQDALRELADGRIWVATARGAAVLDPEEWRKRRQHLDAPFVHVETVSMDDQSLFDPGTREGNAESARIVVPPGTRRLEFRYTAINLTANWKSRFRYRLTGGSDNEWLDAADQRTAVYHRLRPGKYRFQVTAANKYGLWNNEGATVAFTIQPFWWQTLPARFGMGVLLLGLVWYGGAIRLRQLRRRRAHQEEFARRLIESQEAERKRIAAELHDSLGQNLLIAKNQLSLARESVGDAWTQGKLKQVGESVDAALSEARTISRQLRPFQLERLGLTSAIRSMIRQTSESTKIPINAQIDPVDALLPADAEVMVYRILQEALSNVVKHADASEVQIKIGRNGHHLRMVVQDDGRGFDAETMLNGENGARGLGLTGFQERTHLLHGHFHCRSSPGQGTTLTFEVPIPETHPGEAKDKNNPG